MVSGSKRRFGPKCPGSVSNLRSDRIHPGGAYPRTIPERVPIAHFFQNPESIYQLMQIMPTMSRIIPATCIGWIA